MAVYHYGPFMFGKLPLRHVLWLQKIRYRLFYGWKETIITTFKIGKLPLGLVLWLAVYHYG